MKMKKIAYNSFSGMSEDQIIKAVQALKIEVDEARRALKIREDHYNKSRAMMNMMGISKEEI